MCPSFKFFRKSNSPDVNLFASSPSCFRGLESINQMGLEGFRHSGQFKAVSPHSMTFQLLARSIRPEYELLEESEPRFEKLLEFSTCSNKRRRAYSIILSSGPGHYRHLAMPTTFLGDYWDLQATILDGTLPHWCAILGTRERRWNEQWKMSLFPIIGRIYL